MKPHGIQPFLAPQDIKSLGFLPLDFDTTALKPILTRILSTGVLDAGSNLRCSPSLPLPSSLPLAF